MPIFLIFGFRPHAKDTILVLVERTILQYEATCPEISRQYRLCPVYS